jgi:hypothetical protein
VSFNIDSIQRALEPAAPAAARVDALPSAPPHEVLGAIAAADRIYQELALDGHELHFQQDPRSSRVTIQLRDLTGKALRTITPSEALEIACERMRRVTAVKLAGDPSATRPR